MSCRSKGIKQGYCLGQRMQIIHWMRVVYANYTYVIHIIYLSIRIDDEDSNLLSRAGAMTSRNKLSNKLPPSKIDIIRAVDANIDEPSSKPINGAVILSYNIHCSHIHNNINFIYIVHIIALSFHSSGSVLVTGGDDKMLRLFRVDGEKNEKYLSMYYIVLLCNCV